MTTTSTRAKSSLKMPKSTEEVNTLLNDYSTADARTREMTAKMDQAIAEIRAEYADDLTKESETMTSTMQRVQMWAEANDDNFLEKKSMDFTHATIGFRTGMPKLKLKVKSWDKAIEKIKQFLPDYVRTKEEVAKDKLLADRSNDAVAKHFSQCGFEVVQEETFFIEPKQEIANAA